MNKAQLVKYVAQQAVILHASAEMAVNAMVDVLVRALVNDGRVAVAGLGVFTKVFRAPRTVRNPQTGEPIDVPASNTVKFRPSAALKEAVNRLRAGEPVGGFPGPTHRKG